jgi:hypothetical protein
MECVREHNNYMVVVIAKIQPSPIFSYILIDISTYNNKLKTTLRHRITLPCRVINVLSMYMQFTNFWYLSVRLRHCSLPARSSCEVFAGPAHIFPYPLSHVNRILRTLRLTTGSDSDRASHVFFSVSEPSLFCWALQNKPRWDLHKQLRMGRGGEEECLFSTQHAICASLQQADWLIDWLINRVIERLIGCCTQQINIALTRDLYAGNVYFES